jgi:hypothetical protein
VSILKVHKFLEDSVAKTIAGTKDLRRAQASGKMAPDARVVKGAADPRQFRCKKCGNLATNKSDGKGGSVLKCTFCGTEYRATLI